MKASIMECAKLFTTPNTQMVMRQLEREIEVKQIMVVSQAVAGNVGTKRLLASDVASPTVAEYMYRRECIEYLS